MTLLSRLRAKTENTIIRLGQERLLSSFGPRTDTDMPRVLFCPSEGQVGASLLRAYNMADALGPLGWTAACLSPVVKQQQRARLIQRFDPDLIVFQQCRHVLNDIDHSLGYPVVLDTDDADFHLTLPGLYARLDRTSRGAVGVIAGSQYLKDWHAERCANTQVIWTGSPLSPGQRTPQAARAPCVAWAQAKPLTYEKELDYVIALDTRLRQQGSQHILRFYGVETGADAQALKQRVDDPSRLELMPPMAYDAFVRSLQEVAVGLSPLVTQSPFSRGKSFGKVLGYLDAMVPAVVADAADHARFFTAHSGVVSNDLETCVQAVAMLLADPEARQNMAQSAFVDYQKALSLEAAARRTDVFLRALL